MDNLLFLDQIIMIERKSGVFTPEVLKKLLLLSIFIIVLLLAVTF